MSNPEPNNVVKLMTPSTDRPSQASGFPRKLLGGLLALGFGAVFGVLGMFFMPYAAKAAIGLIVLGGITGVIGAIVVMKYGGDSRFDPRPVVITHRDDSHDHDHAS